MFVSLSLVSTKPRHVLCRPNANSAISSAAALYREGKHTLTQICETLQICRARVYKDLRHEGSQIGWDSDPPLHPNPLAI